ncbi:MAG: TolC family protein [Candidatus Paceibacteria bacterium]
MKKLFFSFLITLINLYGLNLEEAINELKKNNIDIQLSQTQIELAQSEQNKKEDSTFGQISTFASYTKYNNPRTLAPLTPPINPNVTTSDNLSTVGVSYSVSLFTGFKDKSDIEFSKIHHSLQKNIHTLTIDQMIYNAQTLYLDILSFNHSLKATKNYLKVLQILEENTKKEYHYGQKSLLDTLKIASDIKYVEAEIIQTQTKIYTLKDSLSLLIYGQTKDIEIFEEINDFNIQKDDFQLEDVTLIKIANANIKKANQKYINTKSIYYPKINLNTSYSDTYAKNEDETIVTASVNLNWNFYDFGVSNELIQQAKITQIQSQLDFHKTKQEMQNKINEAKNLIIQNEKLLDSTIAQFELTKKSQDIEKLRFEEGQITIDDYLLAISSSEKVNAKKIASLYTLLKSKYYLEYLTKGK